jgi:alpha-beta hydrolase superfamily lysophospholipase
VANALTRYRELVAADAVNRALNPAGRSRLLEQNGGSDRSIVLFHGFTNSPAQMETLGNQFFERGYTVLIPRLPGHGLSDRATRALDRLDADQLQETSEIAFEAAQALSRRVDTFGISVGAVLAAWLAQTRTTRVAVPLSPFFALPGIPGFASAAAAGAMRALPPMYLWWDPRVKEACKPDHAYPGFPTRALGECLKFGGRVRAAAKTAAPKSERTIVATNSKEPACNNGVTDALVKHWQARSDAVETHVLTDVGLRHDIVELQTYPEARTTVYPRVLQWIAG